MSSQTLPTHGSQANLLTTPTKHTSKLLVGFGIAELVFSIFLFSSCIWSSSVDNAITAAYIGFVCAIFHSLLGALAVLAGRNLDQYRGCLTACLIMGIVGPGIITLITIITDSVQWAHYKSDCWYCRYQYENNNHHSNRYDYISNDMYDCLRRCALPTESLFFPILFFAIIEAVIGIILSGISCCKLCSCCVKKTPGAVYQQPTAQVPAYQPQSYPQQLRADYPPPTYSESTTSTSTQSAIPSVHQKNYGKF